MDEVYRNDTNRDVPLAQPGEFAPIQLGPLRVWPPVVLAPMAGVTNWPFRMMCRKFGAGLYVSEMITAAASKYTATRPMDWNEAGKACGATVAATL